MRRKRTHIEFVEEMKIINSNIEFLDEYKSVKEKILCKCKIDGYEWYAKPDSLLHGRGCPMCSGNARKTHEDFLTEMRNLHPNIEVLEIYKNAKTKILCKCKIDGHEWSSQPNNLLSGQGCPKCAGKIKRTQEEFINEIKKINPLIKIKGTYINTKSNIECYCHIHDYTWFPTANALLNGQGCKFCGYDKLKELKQYSHEEFVNIIKERNPNILILSKYDGNKKKLNIKCNVCDYSWNTSGNSLLQGKGCPRCGGSLKKTHKEFELELKNVKPHIIPVDKYIDSITKIKFRCVKHNCEWEDTPSHVLRDRGCPECAKESYRTLRMKTHTEFVKELNSINSNIKVLGKYNGVSNKILCQCIKDNYKWNAYPNNLLKGIGCPICSNSHGENKISNYLTESNILFFTQYKFDDLFGLKGGLLSYDFFLPNYNILIEYNGEQHYNSVDYFGGEEQFKIQQEHDNRKRKYAEAHNINLIEIPYWDFDNVENILNKYLKEVA